MRKKFPKRQVQASEVDDIWGCDLVEMQEWSRLNKGYRYMLNVIDVVSKYAWSIPLKDKTALTVLKGLKEIIEASDRKPKHIWLDKGKEFYNKHFDEWLADNNVIRYSTFGEHKSVVVERFNRTLKEKMWRRFTAENSRKWIKMVDDLVKEYSNTKHSSISMTPAEASKLTFVRNVRNKTIPTYKNKFKIGDKVRISRIKGIFDKGYLPNWSEELFTVSEVKETNPVTYKLQDFLGNVLDGSFYNEELQKSNNEVYRIEKVLSKKKIDGVDHVLVKWMGYSKKYNQWIPASDLEKMD